MKQLFLIVALAINFCAYSQDDKTVTLVVSGQGKTQDEAKQNALRNAIEQAFGSFISSNTEILNDELVKDEIVSIANGNIQEFEVLSEVEVPEVGHATTLKATVSVTKLTSFVESKGVEIEFKGSLFGANLRQQRINENAELQAIINLCEVSNQILSKSIDYSIEVDEPVKANIMRSFRPQQDDYQILFTIKLSPNKNFDQFVNYFYSSIKAISMPVPEQENYIKLNKDIYYLTVNDDEKYFFRNPSTVIALQNLFLKSNQYLHNYKVVSNLDTITVNTCCFDSNSELGSQNMHYTYSKPEIWHLNSGNSAYSPYGSENNNSGYPQFNFVHNSRKLSSWRTYFEYLLWLRNNEILFESNNYFTQNGSFYKENGNPAHYSWPEYPFNLFPGINKNIGNINLAKIDYYCKYLAIYSEEEISKITKISVAQLK
jgi:hypothetical protein